MDQLRLAYRNGKKITGRSSPKPSTTLSSDLSSFAQLLGRIARLKKLKPEVVDVIGKLVDDILDDIEGRRP